MQALFADLCTYVAFSDEDRRHLLDARALMAVDFPAIANDFYEAILANPNAKAVLGRGERSVGHLRGTLERWMVQGFSGPWDASYVESRARIGRMHVAISLPEHFMISSINGLRLGLMESARTRVSPEARTATQRAIEKLVDIDLALMLHTYVEDLEAKHARAERLATFGQLVGSIGHELRNPLGVIETSLYVLRSQLSAPDSKAEKHLTRIGQQVTLANEIIAQLLSLIRERPLTRQPLDLAGVITEAAQGSPLPQGTKLEFEGLSAARPTTGDPIQLRQVITNLVENAGAAAGPTGTVRVSLEEAEALFLINVDDSGPGVDPTIRARIFDPLVTTKARGVGLGLALVRRIVELHGGIVDFTRGPLGGARFFVRLPKTP